jgi:caffeoyl-CoA O-methyltransferase
MNDAVLAYTEAHSRKEPELLAKLRRTTHLQTLNARMLSGWTQGQLLGMLAQISGAKRMLELGTFTGYSALCMMMDADSDATLDTIEPNRELSYLHQTFFQEANLSERIKVHYREADQVLPKLQGPYDLIFIDADKKRNELYYQLCLPLLRSGGLMLVDNVLWDQKVAHEQHQDPDTVIIRAFNQLVASDSNVDVLMLPMRDGLSLIRKK